MARHGRLWATSNSPRPRAIPRYAADTTVDFRGVAAKFVKLTIKSNWGGVVKQYGLSEVRFYAIPVTAREPSPATGATAVHPQVTLSWRAGREAASHKVYLSDDQQAVIEGTAPAATVTEPTYEAAAGAGERPTTGK